MTGGELLHSHRASPLAFWLGTTAVSLGVGLHLRTFINSASMGYCMAGLEMDGAMMVGMLIIVEVAAAKKPTLGKKLAVAP
jgi:hypothetical protein